MAVGCPGELIDVEALPLALHEVRTAFDKAKPRRRRSDVPTDQHNRLGVRIDVLAETLQPLRRVHRISDNGVIDAVRGADIADHDRAHMNTDADAHRREAGPSA